ncbi:MAG: GTPase (G3E family), partial [Lachnospiraceae bacterium]|nr:GTPase (G3E family) [Lachnospiraceae bacterium]
RRQRRRRMEDTSEDVPAKNGSTLALAEGLNRNTWLQLNATRQEITLSPIRVGQEVLIVIGENLNEEAIQRYLTTKII